MISGTEVTATPNISDPPTKSGEAVVFLHIPKTAGTTLNRIIDKQYSPFAIYTVDPFQLSATVERFQRLPEKRRRRLQVVRGHFPYGIHQFLPQGATYITMLRDPVARVLSAYYFVLRRPLNPMHRRVKKERLGVADCLRLFPRLRNVQCKYIAGVEETAESDERLLEMAKENLLNSFSIVGISERFEESLVLIAKKLGWQLSFYQNQRVAKQRPSVSPELVNLIREQNPLDEELYRFGRELFEESVHENRELVEQGLADLHRLPSPGKLGRAYHSGVVTAKFLLNKIVSASS